MDPTLLQDDVLRHLAMNSRALLPVAAPQLRLRLEASVPPLFAECERRGLDVSWEAWRAAVADRRMSLRWDDARNEQAISKRKAYN